MLVCKSVSVQWRIHRGAKGDPLQQYYHFNPFYKSTTLALKNFFPNAPFDFLSSLYLYVSTSIALLDANSMNLFCCSVSCPVVSSTKASIKSPLLLEASFF